MRPLKIGFNRTSSQVDGSSTTPPRRSSIWRRARTAVRLKGPDTYRRPGDRLSGAIPPTLPDQTGAGHAGPRLSKPGPRLPAPGLSMSSNRAGWAASLAAKSARPLWPLYTILPQVHPALRLGLLDPLPSGTPKPPTTQARSPTSLHLTAMVRISASWHPVTRALCSGRLTPKWFRPARNSRHAPHT